MADALDVLVANTLKTLAIDAVEAANSGHPGMPMGMADAASVLWRDFLVVDPSQPGLVSRDRFVLSAGHGSMLLYGLLHLGGFPISLDDLRTFRQLHSNTPGHPEFGETVGVETTTGPLGQGIANAIGMALGQALLAARFDRPGFALLDHHVYAICSDGDLQEGISHEAAALAGHLGLGRLVVLYDDNSITIEGDTDLAMSEDVGKRFDAYGWHVLTVDGHDHGAVRAAVTAGRGEAARPTLICCRTHIGHGSPNKQDSESSHGSPLGAEETRLTKRQLGWPEDATFRVPPEAFEAFGAMRERGRARSQAWAALFARYEAQHPELAALWRRIHEGDGLVGGLEELMPRWEDGAKEATRASSGRVINALAEALPQLIGGSADLAGSNKTMVSGGGSIGRATMGARNLHFGIREHGMAALMNGMALYGGVIPYGGTFLVFSDYMRPSMRLAALMKQRVIYVLSHDSIFLGEDGPTHQAVEHAWALRLIPGLDVHRPADGRETAAAWSAALRRTDGPSALLLSRQGLPQLPGTRRALDAVGCGAYVVEDCAGTPDLVLIGTGSELALCVQAAALLSGDGVAVRVVSMPCVDRFLAQPRDVRARLLPAGVPRLSVEAGRTLGWQAIVGLDGDSVGIDSFGASAPAEVLAEHFGFTVENVVARGRDLVHGRGVRGT